MDHMNESSGLEQFPSSFVCLPQATLLGHGGRDESSCSSDPKNLFASPRSKLGPDAVLALPLTCHLLPSERGNALVQASRKFLYGRF